MSCFLYLRGFGVRPASYGVSGSLKLCFAKLPLFRNVTAELSIGRLFNRLNDDVTICTQYIVSLARLCAGILMLVPSRGLSLTYFSQPVQLRDAAVTLDAAICALPLGVTSSREMLCFFLLV